MKIRMTLTVFAGVLAVIAAIKFGRELPTERAPYFVAAWVALFTTAAVLAAWPRPLTVAWGVVSIVASEVWGWVRRRLKRGPPENGEPS